uniref:Uncharacterized protein n=1 Tax=Anopheles farauti TaxID=69004 RepID=A0A182QST7_9DIPT
MPRNLATIAFLRRLNDSKQTAGEMMLASGLFVLFVVVPGFGASYPSVAGGHENVFPHALKNVHTVESSGQQQPFTPSQEYNPEQEEEEELPEHPNLQPAHQYPLYRHHPAQAEVPPQHHLFQPHQQYLVQSGYNVGSHPEHPVHQQHQHGSQGKQRQTAAPLNNERLHVKVEHPGAAHGFTHPITPSVPHLRQQLEPKKDYRSYIPKSIAPKLNPLHHSFHQNRNFVPLHHITRKVPLPAGKVVSEGSSQHHYAHHGHQQPVKAALVAGASQIKHVAG